MKKHTHIKTIATVVIIATCLTSFYASAQMSGPPDFDAKKAAGLIQYDYSRVIKKLKVEEDTSKAAIIKIIDDFNVKIYNLLSIHGNVLEDLDAEFDRNVKIAMAERDPSRMNGTKAKIKQTIPPIRKEALVHEKWINDAMSKLLDDKQQKKWLRYQEQMKN